MQSRKLRLSALRKLLAEPREYRTFLREAAALKCGDWD